MTNADILFLVGTIAVVLLTGFLCMALFYVICILRRVHRTLHTVEERAESFLDSWREFAGRINAFRTSLDIIASGLKAALTLYQRRSSQDTDEEHEEDGEYEKDMKEGRTRKGRKKIFSSENDA